MLYDENDLESAIASGERRLARARQRQRRARRTVFWALLAAAIGIPIAIAAGVATNRAPDAPFLVVTWPKPKIPQTLASGQTVLMRQGQPLMVTVTNANDWEINWRAGEVSDSGEDFTWSPTPEKRALNAICKPRARDWTSYFAFLWPRRDLNLSAAFAKRGDEGNAYFRSLNADEKGVWVFPHIQAVGNVQWDERALPHLGTAISLVPKSALAGELASIAKEPTSRLWQLVNDFDGNTDKLSEKSTFASLQAPDLENLLPTIAAHLVKTAPEASVKFIVRLDKDPQQGIVRLAFDGKRERKAWIRRAGQKAGVPFVGWENGEFRGSPPLALPEVP